MLFPALTNFLSKNLFSLTRLYFIGEASGERSMCILCGITYWLISMGALLLDDNTLEVGLDTSYQAFNESASMFLGNQTLSSR